MIPIKELKRTEGDELFGKFAIFVAVLMVVAIMFFYALDKAMLVGFLCYGVKQIVEEKRVNLYLWVPTILLLISVVLQFVVR